MRDKQLKLEEGYFKQTTVDGFIGNLDNNRDATILVDMCDSIVSAIDVKHGSVQRKRAPFFKLTKELEYKEVAFIGLKVLIADLVMNSSLPVTLLGTKIGDGLLSAIGRSEDSFSNDHKIIVDKVSAGIELLGLILQALKPLKIFRAEIERLSKSVSIWKVSSTESWDELVEENQHIFATISAKRMPMICKPDDWKDMIGGGYLSDVGKALNPFVKGKHKHDLPDGDQLFSSVNHMQSTPHRVNKRIFGLYRLLQAARPDKMKKLFINDLPKSFTEECPIDREEDKYLWEKAEGTKVDSKTGKEKKAMVLVHQDEESNDKRQAFFKWVDRKDAYTKKVAGKKSLDRAMQATIDITDMVKDEEILCWAYGLDNRSRVYPSAMSGINLQGADHQKAVLEFSVGLPLDFDGDGEGGEYGIIKTLCNHWGGDSGNGVKTDKLTEEDARTWLIGASVWIIKCANNPMEHCEWMGADKPLQFLAAAFEWASWREYFIENGNYGFISHLPDPNDASCSGAQILSAMTRDRIGATHTNLCALPNAQDLYMAVAGKTLDNLLSVFSEDTMAQDWLGRTLILEKIQAVLEGTEDDILSLKTQEMIILRSVEFETVEEIFLNTYLDFERLEQERLSFIIRNLVKKPVMVKFYSGTRYGNIQHCSEFIVKEGWEDYFRCDGTGKAASYLGNLIFDSINQVIVGAGLVMEWFVHVADILGSTGKPVKWKTPLGFNATMAKYRSEMIRTKVDFLGEVRRFSIKVDKYEEDKNGVLNKVLDVGKMKSAVAPDLVHSLDSCLIQAVSFRCKREGIDNLLFIHDSLGAHCCYTRRFNRIIREEFIGIFKHDLLQEMYEGFKSQLDEDDQSLLLSPRQFGIVYGDYDLDEMLNSVHCFK